jgi:hypothetical protein
MNTNNTYKISNFLFLSIILIITGCANIVAPSGGVKDVTPPMPVKSEPNSNTTCFNQKYFRIWFDEFIKLKDITNKIIISPPLNESPDISIKGKSILVKLNENLKENTTYNISFENVIADITEGNTLPQFQYVFSTGKYIDSMTIKGKVIDAFSLEPSSDVAIMLYKENLDSLPLIKKPDFIGKTNKAGEFAVNNLPCGKFKVFALKDANNNYIYDLPNEQIAFIDTMVSSYFIKKSVKDSLKKDTVNEMAIKYPELELYLFTEVDSTQKLIKYDNSIPGQLKFIFKFPVKNFSFKPLKPLWTPNMYVVDPSYKGDTIMLWYTDIESDSLEAIISCAAKYNDTLKIKLAQEKNLRTTSKRVLELEKLKISFSATPSKPVDLNQSFKIFFSKPIISQNFNNIIFYDNKDTIKPEIHFLDSTRRILEINYNWKENTEYFLYANPETFKDIHGFYNDSIRVKFKSKQIDDYGILKIKIENFPQNTNIILQLLNVQNNKIIKEIQVDKAKLLKIDYLAPGNYQIKTIYDKNRNGQWDTGIYLKKVFPEKVEIYNQNIKIKGGWEAEINLKL